MEPSFKALPAAKRRRILDAALQEFAAHDYKSANTDTIAARAGISKGALFYYFKNKQSLYLTLIRYLSTKVEREMHIEPPAPGADLFELMNELSAKKLPLFKSVPGLMEFSVRVFYHGGGELGALLDRYMTRMTEELFDKYFGQVDTAPFRPGCTPRQAVDLLMYLTDGYLHMEMMSGRPLSMDELFARYDQWQEMVRRFVYKEDCL